MTPEKLGQIRGLLKRNTLASADLFAPLFFEHCGELLAEVDALTASLKQQDDAVLTLTAHAAFIAGTDTPDTERRARAILVQRLASLGVNNAS